MRKFLMLLAVVSVCGWFMGCATSKSLNGTGVGGGNGSGSSTFEAGSWAFTTSGGINGQITLGGYLSASGTTVSGDLYVIGSQNSGFTLTSSPTPMAVSGTLSSSTLTLTGTQASSTFTMSFTNLSTTGTNSTLTGTYSVSGGTDNNDSGSISGQVASSFTGTWAGTDTTTAGTMTVDMTQATTPTNGGFTLSSTGTGVTFAGAAGCTVTGTLNSTSFSAGGIVLLNISTTDNNIPGQLFFVGLADNPASPMSLSGVGYTYTGGTSCMLQNTGNQVNFTMTKQ